MIEFKAECGHTVRAKDQDGGKVVRCSYCGKAANVPEGAGGGGGGGAMDFLLTELEQSNNAAVATAAPKRRARSIFGRRRKKAEGEFDPFAFVMKMVWAAALVAVVYIVSAKFLAPLIMGTQKPGGEDPYAAAPANDAPSPVPQPARNRTMGLRSLAGAGGLFIGSSPAGAEVYYIPEAAAPAFGERIGDRKGAMRGGCGPQAGDIPAGRYVVEVVFKWTDGSLNAFPGFREFREGVRSGDAQARERLMKEYFLPDESVDSFVHQTEDQTFLVRQYEAEVREGRWASVRALFLPRIKSVDGPAFAVGPVVRYLAEDKPYVFDEALVRRELDFYRVPATDRQFIVDMLRGVGITPYVTPDGRTQMFKISVEDGSFGVKDLGPASP